MKDAELASELRDYSAAAEQSVERLRSIGENELADNVERGAGILARAAARIECGPLDRPEPGEIITMTEERVWGLAFQAAGAASVPFMRDHPQYVMPDGDITEGVTNVLADFGFTAPPVGYKAAVPDQTDAAIAARERTRRRMEGD
jgi:hypothetical protein